MGLIDADALKKDLESVTLSNGTLLNTNTVLLLLDKYPTAYDVDKVVEELEAEQQKYKAQALGTDDTDTVFRCAIKEVTMQTAINIVKRGGNIELSEHSESQGNRTGK
jgi:hypothetical protein